MTDEFTGFVTRYDAFLPGDMILWTGGTIELVVSIQKETVGMEHIIICDMISFTSMKTRQQWGFASNTYNCIRINAVKRLNKNELEHHLKT